MTTKDSSDKGANSKKVAPKDLPANQIVYKGDPASIVPKSDSLVDVEFLSGMTGGDMVFIKELLDIFLNSSKSNIEKMEKAMNEKDDGTWYSAAHSFKGASATIGSFALARVLEYAQSHPKEKLENKVKILNEIKVEFEKVVQAIKKEIAKI